MAKLFQLYDPLKEGKGVKKNAPKKKSFFEFFEVYISNFWKLLIAGVLYIPFAITLIPSGLGNAGITFIARSASLRRPFFTVAEFFETIKKNWKQALPIGIINVIITALLIFDMYFFYFSKGNSTIITICLAMAFFAYIVFCSMKYYIYHLLITFDFSIAKLYKNAFHLTFINFFKNIGVELILAALYLLPLLIWYFGLHIQFVVIIYLFGALLFFPGFKAFLVSKLCFPVIKKIMIDPYYEKNPDADIEKRRALGILENDPLDEEERIFND